MDRIILVSHCVILTHVKNWNVYMNQQRIVCVNKILNFDFYMQNTEQMFR